MLRLLLAWYSVSEFVCQDNIIFSSLQQCSQSTNVQTRNLQITGSSNPMEWKDYIDLEKQRLDVRKQELSVYQETMNMQSNQISRLIDGLLENQ